MADDPIRAQLRNILSSTLFSRSERLSRFLNFVVDEALKGSGDELKEYRIGLAVFDKDSSFDPRTDPIVRVQARRLRAALTEYYATEGRNDPILVSIPRGRYVPSFESHLNIPATKRGIPWPISAAGLCVLILIAISLVSARAPATSRFTSIAVLPFLDLSSEKDQEYFCDGLTEEILDKLTRIQGLRVPARTSSFRFKGRNPDLQLIGEQLNVQAVIEGSVRSSGNRLRITTKLVKVTDGSPVWSETLDREKHDTFAIQEELSQIVLRKLNFHLSDNSSQPQNPEAYRDYLNGRFHFNQWTHESVLTSIRYYRQAIGKDSKYAPSYAGLASAHAVLAHWGTAPVIENWSANLIALKEAMRLDPNLAEAHVSLGMRKAHFEWDWPGAEMELRRALELNPRSTEALRLFAVVLHANGRFREADGHIRQALDLDPFSAKIHVTHGLGFYWARQYDRAIATFRKALELEPNFSQALAFLGAAYAETRMYPEALEALGAARRLAPRNSEILSLMGYTLAQASQREKALAILSEMKNLSLRQSIPNLDFASVRLALGDRELALQAIKRACDAREGRLVRLKVDPRYDLLRPEPRFQAALKLLGFAP